ncbi:MAG: hypothetical protein L0H31_00960, partial [Nocardioidaceae bacterium]|nr:hypothetical protein [Nocardioidaceae bacterium]
MKFRRRASMLAVVCALAGVLSACSGQEDSPDTDRVVLTPVAKGAGQAAGNPVGDGTQTTVRGYRLRAVRLPGPRGPGPLSFRILDRSGDPVSAYEKEQTKLLHLYVVRNDLSEFRHVHPTLGKDGTWRGRVDLGSPGRWRLVAEFVPAGGDRPIVLGTAVRVPGTADKQGPNDTPAGDDSAGGDSDPATDGVVRVRLLTDGELGP